MKMSEAKKDKRVYHYRSAFEQPTWIQKLSDRFSLPNAIKLSTIGWTAFLFFTYYWIVTRLVMKIIPLPLPFWIGVGTPLLWSAGIVLSDFTIEQQKISRFIRDYLKFYRIYGRKRKQKYLNDGILYYKPDYILKKEGELSETNE